MHFIIFDISRVLVIFSVTFRIFVPHFPFRKTSFSMKGEMKNQNFDEILFAGKSSALRSFWWCGFHLTPPELGERLKTSSHFPSCNEFRCFPSSQRRKTAKSMHDGKWELVLNRSPSSEGVRGNPHHQNDRSAELFPAKKVLFQNFEFYFHFSSKM